MDEANITKAAEKVLDLLKNENLTCDSAMRCLERCHDVVNEMLTKKFSEISGQSFREVFENYQH